MQNKNVINPVSLFFTNIDMLIEKNIVAIRNGIITWSSVHAEPIWGRLNHLVTSTRIYAVITM
ncbi:MAG TPA: hypothetical protein PLG03_01970 [Bacteroidales bacterium]|nr:hypothetical protein [Bacteroidales bacterium]HRR48383.1 hypothetical protein [Bacteroidales bacterium]HRT32839.1 hypothetical protein [Bacteroidales bacterium]HRT83538.1 hypothetical protein [Bacteroidales bacterium]